MRGTGFASITWGRRKLFRRYTLTRRARIGALHQKTEAAQSAAGGQKPKRIEARRQHGNNSGAGHSDGRPSNTRGLGHHDTARDDQTVVTGMSANRTTRCQCAPESGASGETQRNTSRTAARRWWPDALRLIGARRVRPGGNRPGPGPIRALFAGEQREHARQRRWRRRRWSHVVCETLRFCGGSPPAGPSNRSVW